MDKMTCCINIPHFQEQGFLEPQAAGIDGCVEDKIVKGFDVAEYKPDFSCGKNCGKPSFNKVL
jgi:hypothetical protein